MTPQELVATLKSQHAALKSDLSSVLAKAQSNAINIGQDCVAGLTKFKVDLNTHLDLENGTFYPQYLDKKVKRGEDIESTKEFINQMMEIGKQVGTFLDKYSTMESIDKDVASFANELSQIFGVLKIRIESEEEGVYDIFLLL